MNVLSLFDGMSCGQIALQRANITYTKYYASEIDKHAINATQKNFPNTIQLGDVRFVKGENLPQIDLLIGGSPCTGFSMSGKMLNFNDPHSKLFFEFLRLVKECKPKYWLLENVAMKKEYEQIISDYLGVPPIKINSRLVSAHNRERLYWSNFEITQPLDKNIKLVDILETKDYINPCAIRGRKLNKDGERLREKHHPNVPYTQCIEVRDSNTDKSNCLTTVEKDNALTNLPYGRYIASKETPFRYYSIKEYCRLQTVPDDYFDDSMPKTQIKKMIGNGWTVDVIAHIFKCLQKHIDKI